MMNPPSEIRTFMLNPGVPTQRAFDTSGQYPEWSPATCGIWFRWPDSAILVFGHAENQLLAFPYPMQDGDDAENVRSVREMGGPPWNWTRNLEPEDKLPGWYGPTVEDYIVRMEAEFGDVQEVR